MRNQNPKRILRAENLEDRRCMTASFGWDGPGQGSAALTYTVNANGSGLSQQEVEDAVDRALDAWSDVADISFTQVDQVGLRDSLDISFRRLDGTGGTLAQAYFPDDVNPARVAGDIQFDTSENWEIGNGLGSRAFDLVQVAVHEIGHALGLEHDHEHDSILRSSVSPQESFNALGQSDVDAILSLYAPASSPASGGSAINPPKNNTNTIQPNVQPNLPDTHGTDDEQSAPREDTSPTDQPTSKPTPWLRRWNRWVNRFSQRFQFHWSVPSDSDAAQEAGNNPTTTTTITIRWFSPRIRWR